MPELPEVETVVRELRPVLPGRAIETACLRYRTLYRRGSLPVSRLVGRRFDRVERVGKNAVFWFKPAGLMLVNLGMTGRPLYWDGGSEPEGVSRKHLHLRVGLSGGAEFRFYDARRFGHIYVAEACDFTRELGIGPDPFDADVDYLREKLRGRSAAIKSLLLDQGILSGIGNIYADELLFAAGVDPRHDAGRVVRRAARILDNARVILERAIDHGGSTLRDYRRIDGSEGSFQHLHAVYGREGESCVKCGRRIKRVVLGGRSTHFCPRCQR